MLQAILPSRDVKLLQIIDNALAETARKSGGWLVCRKGCTQCCIGVFPINQLDAMRLRKGMSALEMRDPDRAAAVRERARNSIKRLSPNFPGNIKSGMLPTKKQKSVLQIMPMMNPVQRSHRRQVNVSCTRIVR